MRCSQAARGLRLAGGTFLAALVLVAGGAEPGDPLASLPSPEPSLPPAQLSVGVQWSGQQVDSFGDMLVPVYQRPTELLFINPRGTWNDEQSREFSIGLGGRHLFPDRNIIVGANLYYDRRESSLDNTFNQAGFGLEWLSQWVDARANFYFPEQGEKSADDYVVTPGTLQEHAEYWYAPSAQGHVISQYGYEMTDSYTINTLQHYRTTEQARDGFDAELGSLLPLPVLRHYADIKAFVGFYQYSAAYGSGVSGLKARVEIRPLPALYLDAGWVEDAVESGAQGSVGVRAAVPFDLARLSRGRNPFAGALAGFRPGGLHSPFASRLTEMVMRDLHIRTEVSAPTEVVGDRRIIEKTLVSHERKDMTDILASDVTFVDADNRTGLEAGTWENPYRQINAGVQNAIGALVYVSEAARPYDENVVLRKGLTLWGSGAPLQGPHGVFQGTVFPVVNGGGKGPVITLANETRVTGFELVQPAGTPLASPVIFGEDVSGVTISHNIIQGNGSAVAGIQLQAVHIPVVAATIRDNRISGVAGTGINIDLATVPLVELTLDQNTVSGNSGDGARISAIDCDVFHLYVSGNYSGNGGDGLALQAFTQEARVEGASLAANANGGNGVFLDVYGYRSVQVAFDTLEAANNHSDGLHAVLAAGGSVQVSLVNSRLTGNSTDGVFLDLDSGLDSFVVARGNDLSRNGANGVHLQTLAPWDSVYDFGQATDYGLNAFYGNGAFQMMFDGLGMASAAGNWWGTPAPVDHVDYQAVGGGTIIAAPALPAP
ncbi:MAG: inverse autotransporter beta domain-containing protein [bacterium]